MKVVEIISDGTASDDKLHLLMITVAKYNWHNKPVSVGDTYVLTLGWQDTGYTKRTNSKHNRALPEVLQIAYGRALNPPSTNAEFICCQANVASCYQVALFVSKLDLIYLYECVGIFVRQ